MGKDSRMPRAYEIWMLLTHHVRCPV